MHQVVESGFGNNCKDLIFFFADMEQLAGIAGITFPGLDVFITDPETLDA